MNRSTIQSAIVVLAIACSVALFLLLGNPSVALALSIVLVARLLDVFVYSKKDDPAQLSYRSQQLTDPLQKMFANLRWGTRLCQWAIQTFEIDIEGMGRVKMLKKDSPALVEHLTKLRSLIENARKEPFTEEQAKEAMGEVYKETATVQDRQNYVMRSRLGSSKETAELIKKIREEIEDVLAKYGGVS